MKILASEPLRPFSHSPGTEWLLPGLTFSVRIYPCKILVFDQGQNRPILVREMFFDFLGPLKQFTTQLDLQKNRLSVFGCTKEGWVRYYLYFKCPQGIYCLFDRVPDGKTGTFEEKSKIMLEKGVPIELLKGNFPLRDQTHPLEKLFLGNHKAPDIELIRRRGNLHEIFPLIFQIGQTLPKMEISETAGMFQLLRRCRESFEAHLVEEGHNVWHDFLFGAFSPALMPKLLDDEYLGLIPNFSGPDPKGSPLVLLQEAYLLMRQLFVTQDDNKITFLPYLLPEFHSGRLLDFSIEGLGSISFEWTKKCLRRLFLSTTAEAEFVFDFKSSLKKCRVREKSCEKGFTWLNKTPIHFQKNRTYLFDNFQ